MRSLSGFALSIRVVSIRNSHPLCSTTYLTSLRSVHAIPLRYVPVVDMGDLGPVRCGRCKAHMNLYVCFMANNTSHCARFIALCPCCSSLLCLGGGHG